MSMPDARILLMRVGWPAFLGACVLELLVFAMVDPRELHWAGQTLEMRRQGIYTAAFCAFWSQRRCLCGDGGVGPLMA